MDNHSHLPPKSSTWPQEAALRDDSCPEGQNPIHLRMVRERPWRPTDTYSGPGSRKPFPDSPEYQRTRTPQVRSIATRLKSTDRQNSHPTAPCATAHTKPYAVFSFMDRYGRPQTLVEAVRDAETMHKGTSSGGGQSTRQNTRPKMDWDASSGCYRATDTFTVLANISVYSPNGTLYKVGNSNVTVETSYYSYTAPPQSGGSDPQRDFWLVTAPDIANIIQTVSPKFAEHPSRNTDRNGLGPRYFADLVEGAHEFVPLSNITDMVADAGQAGLTITLSVHALTRRDRYKIEPLEEVVEAWNNQ